MTDFDALPDAVLAGLSGLSAAADQATALTTCDRDGFVRIALLSRSEIAVVDPSRLRLALWAESRSTANLRRDGRATLFRIDEQAAYSIRIRCGPPVLLGPAGEQDPIADRPLVAMAARVVSVQADQVGYARITSGLMFTATDPEAVTRHWARVAEALAVADPPPPPAAGGPPAPRTPG